MTLPMVIKFHGEVVTFRSAVAHDVAGWPLPSCWPTDAVDWLAWLAGGNAESWVWT
jgi:hypothetical protein